MNVDDIVPSKYRSLFRFNTFNAMQSLLVTQIMSNDKSMVVAAPTGSGKTVVHELAILRLMISADAQQGINQMKCVFIAPNKALCQQRCVEWLRSFGSLGLL